MSQRTFSVVSTDTDLPSALLAVNVATKMPVLRYTCVIVRLTLASKSNDSRSPSPKSNRASAEEEADTTKVVG
jgi:hypothetical protein